MLPGAGGQGLVLPMPQLPFWLFFFLNLFRDACAPPRLPALSLEGSGAAVLRFPPRCPRACPRPLHPGAFASSTCAARQLCPGSCHPRGGFAQGRGLPCSGAVPFSVCPSAEPTPPLLLESCGRLLAEPPRGPAGAFGGPVSGLVVRGWPVAGTAGAQPLNVASVKFVSSVLGGRGGVFVFLNKCTKERLGFLCRSSG